MWSEVVKQFQTTPNHVQHVIKIFLLVKGLGRAWLEAREHPLGSKFHDGLNKQCIFVVPFYLAKSHLQTLAKSLRYLTLLDVEYLPSLTHTNGRRCLRLSTTSASKTNNRKITTANSQQQQHNYMGHIPYSAIFSRH